MERHGTALQRLLIARRNIAFQKIPVHAKAAPAQHNAFRTFGVDLVSIGVLCHDAHNDAILNDQSFAFGIEHNFCTSGQSGRFHSVNGTVHAQDGILPTLGNLFIEIHARNPN